MVAASAMEEQAYRPDATVSGPITDSLDVRLTGKEIEDNGWAQNAYDGKKFNDTKGYTVLG